MTKVAISGVAGRMGKMLVQAAYESKDVELTAPIVRPNSSLFGVDVGEIAGIGRTNIKTVGSLESMIDHFDVVIDFTNPSLTMSNLAVCQQARKKFVIGTTGLDDEQQAKIEAAGNDIPIVFAPNMSLGINVVLQLIKQTANAIGHDSDIEIVEMHHRHKIDSPSGTALKMGEVAADSLGHRLEDCAVYGREGQTGARDSNTIGFATLRGGDVVGDHTIIFASEGERVEITHKASSRMTFAKGAIRAAQWLQQQEPGFYSMQDVLNLS